MTVGLCVIYDFFVTISWASVGLMVSVCDIAIYLPSLICVLSLVCLILWICDNSFYVILCVTNLYHRVSFFLPMVMYLPQSLRNWHSVWLWLVIAVCMTPVCVSLSHDVFERISRKEMRLEEKTIMLLMSYTDLVFGPAESIRKDIVLHFASVKWSWYVQRERRNLQCIIWLYID